ncbi:MAG: nuclear transport factor 2 family protein [Reyranella sp.]|uniref:nuclear transport factor 2 family protein n=1 Tax=Reyranella sp. TaxID=1929291 RepID=UPI002730C062|nr:nuclear transport factor 2 family protein [Reyranella sp.]MDP1962854.1 nuclear transport factor 2 family protein [Reyranella sp.]MDP2378522.1 nuclear transport factor 2 family protein [Reyranella sp.]
MLRRSLLATATLLPATSALAHPPQAPQGAEAQRMIDEVTAFRARLARAIETKDFNTLRSSYADSFSHTHGSGKVDNKDAHLAAAMAGEPLIEAAPASELVFRVFTGPTVIVTGKSPILNVKDGKTYDFRWVSVYVTAISGWQLAVSQATRLS